MEIFKVEVDTFGGSPVATHNMPCAVCRAKHAVLNLNIGIMEPCWDCQKYGWALIKKRRTLSAITKEFFAARE